jgi:hypothetical protein
MNDIHHTAITCPVCGTVNDCQADAIDENARQPQDGDVSVCFTCTSFLTFTDGATKQRLLTPDEIVDLPAEIRSLLVKTRKAIKEVQAEASQ